MLELGKIYRHKFHNGITLYKNREEFMQLDWRQRKTVGSLDEFFMIVDVYGPIYVESNSFYDYKILSDKHVGWFRLYTGNIGFLEELTPEKAELYHERWKGIPQQDQSEG